MTVEKSILWIDNIDFMISPLEINDFQDKDVIFLVLTMAANGEAEILDVGQSGEYGSAPMDTPQRRACWQEHSHGSSLHVGVHRLHVDNNMKEDRLRIISMIRTKYPVQCGA